jgi:hypothetical protein
MIIFFLNEFVLLFYLLFWRFFLEGYFEVHYSKLSSLKANIQNSFATRFVHIQNVHYHS